MVSLLSFVGEEYDRKILLVNQLYLVFVLVFGSHMVAFKGFSWLRTQKSHVADSGPYGMLGFETLSWIGCMQGKCSTVVLLSGP